MFDILMVFLIEIFEKVDFEKKNQQTAKNKLQKNMQKYPLVKDLS